MILLRLIRKMKVKINCRINILKNKLLKSYKLLLKIRSNKLIIRKKIKEDIIIRIRINGLYRNKNKNKKQHLKISHRHQKVLFINILLKRKLIYNHHQSPIIKDLWQKIQEQLRGINKLKKVRLIHYIKCD